MAKFLEETTQNVAVDLNLQMKKDSYDYTHAKSCDI